MNIAMILAAGRGERLRPLTDNIPKALCRVHDVPLIEYHVIKLAQAGFDRIVINHAYLGGQIREYLGSGSKYGIEICYAPEPPGGLETGGGLFNARALLGTKPFLAINADIYTDYPFTTNMLSNLSNKNILAHLILVNIPTYSKHGDFGLSNTQILNNNLKNYTFSGMAIYHPNILQQQTPGRYSITPILRQLAIDDCASGEIYFGQWFDIGTIERLQSVP